VERLFLPLSGGSAVRSARVAEAIGAETHSLAL